MNAEAQGVLRKTVAGLGDTAEDIAAKLMGLGVTGEPGSSSTCPIANVTKDEMKAAGIDFDDVSVTGSGRIKVLKWASHKFETIAEQDATAAVKQFVQQFDDVNFPIIEGGDDEEMGDEGGATMPTLADLPGLVDAGFSAVWVRSHEQEEVERATLLMANAASPKWELYAWDCARGVRNLRTNETAAQAATPVDAVKNTPWGQRPDAETPAVLLLHNLHRFSDNGVVAQFLLNEALDARKNRRVLVAAGPVVRLPAELEKVFAVVDHALPGEAELG